jgi:hypothetical protein
VTTPATGHRPPATGTEDDSQLAKSRRRDTQRRRLQVHNALTQLRADGAVITVSSVARAARVHRSFIHRHADLHAALQAAAVRPAEPIPTNSTAGFASMKADLLNARAQDARLQQRISTLQDRLSEALGETAFRTTGLGAPDDVRGLHQSLVDSEQQILELRRQLEERTDELDAARAADRELMTQLNARPT